MKIECTKFEWSIIESMFMEKYGSTSTSYQHPKFHCEVKGCDGMTDFDIDGTFSD